MISVYSPDKPFTVYHHSDWESDAWDPLQYGSDFDFTKPFFPQFAAQQLKVPKKGLHVADDMINCDYCNYGGSSKDCYLTFLPYESENCIHSRVPYACKFDLDGEANLQCQYTYECVSCMNCYESFYCHYCTNCNTSAFLIDCISCADCFGCIGLKHAKHNFLNQQLTPEEYQKQTAHILKSPESLTQFLAEFEKLKTKSIYKYARNTQAEASTGDILRNVKNCHECFDLIYQEDSKFCDLGGASAHHIYDSTIAGLNMVYGYEQIGSQGCHNSAFMVYVDSDQDCFYCIACRNCEHCFGCEGLKYKKYCIFNKQYTKEEYDKLVPKIIEHMTKTGEWGEFFPTSISPYAYNESLANTYFSRTKEQVQKKGWPWRDPDQNVSKEDACVCKSCGKNYRLIKQESDFYEKYQLPQPENCPDCRYRLRLKSMNPWYLWPRQCMHENCENKFLSTYAPDRTELVYCESCYEQR